MKRFVSLSLLLALLFALFTPTVAYGSTKVTIITNDTVTVTINGEVVVFPDQQPILQSGRTFIPVRTVSEYLGATVGWNGDTKTVTIYRDKRYLAMTIGNTKLVIDDQKTGEKRTVQMDVAPFLLGGRTMVPIRFVAEAFDGIVDWNAATRTVIITAEIPERRGNTVGNQAKSYGCSTAMNDRYLFYENTSDFKLYRMNTDGSGRMKLSDDWLPDDINCLDDWVYYTYDNGEGICKVRSDGTGRQELASMYTYGQIYKICVVDNWIYFTCKTPGLFKLSINGGQPIRIYDDRVNLDYEIVWDDGTTSQFYDDRMGGYCVANEWIYFTDSEYGNNYNLYKMTTSGDNLTKLCDGYAGDINVIGGCIYYLNGDINSNDGKIYSINTDGTGKKTVYDTTTRGIQGNIWNVNVCDDWIYYQKINERTPSEAPYNNESICKVKNNGAGYMEIIRDADLYNSGFRDFNVFGDCIYFTAHDFSFNVGNCELYKIYVDGTGLEKLTYYR